MVRQTLERIGRAHREERRVDRGPAARRRGWRLLVRENWYRDAWLFAVTVICVWAVLGIQGQRRDAVRIQCVDQNDRHDSAVRFFSTSPLFKPRRPLSLKQQVRRTETIDAFVQVLVPRRDCDALVKRLVP